MARVACLLLPELPLAAMLRLEPELHGRAVGIVESTRRGQRETILAGWMRGLTLAQARSAQPDLEVRPLSLGAIQAARDALLDVARSISPRIQETRPGVAHIDLEGTGALFPTERGLVTALEARCIEVGLRTVRIGVGPTCTVAELAAGHRGGGFIVLTGRTRDFLDPLPLDLLDPHQEILDRLTRWGVTTLGELTRIPRTALGTRLGEGGVHLARRARGEDLTPFRPVPVPLRFEESLELEVAIDNLETLAFLLRGILDRLTRRLRVRGLAARDLAVELTLQSGRPFERSLELAAPTLEASVLTSLLRTALEQAPPHEPVERIRIRCSPGEVETSQLDLFRPALPAPAELALTLTRLEALCGSGQVGTPGFRDTHLPDPVHVKDFAIRRKASAPVGDPGPLPHPILALRAWRPPRAVRIWQRDGLPERIQLAGRPLEVLERAGPWRIFGEWWGESCFARDYFDVELSDGGIYRLYRNLENESWFVDGIYD